jgi:hypothetical protein
MRPDRRTGRVSRSFRGAIVSGRHRYFVVRQLPRNPIAGVPALLARDKRNGTTTILAVIDYSPRPISACARSTNASRRRVYFGSVSKFNASLAKSAAASDRGVGSNEVNLRFRGADYAVVGLDRLEALALGGAQELHIRVDAQIA